MITFSLIKMPCGTHYLAKWIDTERQTVKVRFWRTTDGSGKDNDMVTLSQQNTGD